MNALKLKRLPKLTVLKHIGRPLLEEFFARFEADLHASGLALPPPRLADGNYLREIAGLLLHPRQLPDSLNDALVVLDEMSSAPGFEQLEASPDWAVLHRGLEADSTREEIVLQLWLRDRAHLIRQHNRLRLVRLTAFEYAGAKTPSGLRPAFDPADKLALVNLTTSLDAWFARNQRGAETTRVEVYPLRGDFYYLIRHADVFTRLPKVERQNTEFMHFHPERDDVVVLSPRLDEIRVNARTRAERDLYISQFGLHLRGDAHYFSERAPYTLEPLRIIGADCLKPRNLPAIGNIRLRELEVSFQDKEHELISRSPRGLFELAALEGVEASPIPAQGRLARAVFELQFSGSNKFYPLEIRVPNMLKVSRHCDFQAIQTWVCQTGFRLGHEALSEEMVAA